MIAEYPCADTIFRLGGGNSSHFLQVKIKGFVRLLRNLTGAFAYWGNQ